MPGATITSFILRFTKEHAVEGERVTIPWRGVIRHVQTSEEVHFVHIEDALVFVSRFVDIAPVEAESDISSEKGESSCV